MPDAPDDTKPAPTEAEQRLKQITEDLDYYRKAIQQMGVGGQPPTVYATKYVEDIEFLMAMAVPNSKPQQEAPKSGLEVALEHDAAGRTERKPAPPLKRRDS